MSAAGILKRIKINTRTDSEMSAEAKAVLSVRGGVRGRTESEGFPDRRRLLQPCSQPHYTSSPLRKNCKQLHTYLFRHYTHSADGCLPAHMTRRHQANSDNLHKFNFALSFLPFTCASSLLCYRSSRGCKARERQSERNVCVKLEDILACSL